LIVNYRNSLQRVFFEGRIPDSQAKKPASRAQILANPASRVADYSRIPSRYFAFSRIPHHILVKSRIPRIPFQTLIEQCAKANRLLGFGRRASRYIQSTQTRHTLYLSIVQCHHGYATQVWSPQSVGLLKQAENVQRRATKLILKLPFRCDVTYKSRLQLTNLLPISYCDEFLDRVFFYKAVNNLVFVDCGALPVTRRLTRFTRSGI